MRVGLKAILCLIAIAALVLLALALTGTTLAYLIIV